jgi:hypothetical protein
MTLWQPNQHQCSEKNKMTSFPSHKISTMKPMGHGSKIKYQHNYLKWVNSSFKFSNVLKFPDPRSLAWTPAEVLNCWVGINIESQRSCHVFSCLVVFQLEKFNIHQTKTYDYFHYIDTLFFCVACLVVMIHDHLLACCVGWTLNVIDMLVCSVHVSLHYENLGMLGCLRVFLQIFKAFYKRVPMNAVLGAWQGPLTSGPTPESKATEP